MAYYAWTTYAEITLPKENFAEVEKRYQEYMNTVIDKDSPDTHRDSYYDKYSYYHGRSEKFKLDDIFNSYGFEYHIHGNSGNITDIVYEESSYDDRKITTFIKFLAGLVEEGNYIEWEGSSGGDDRWMFYHHDNQWSQHMALVDVTYPSKEDMLNGDNKYTRYLT